MSLVCERMSDARSPLHDAFPTTHRTWIVETLRAALESREPGARERALTELRQHVMQRYFEPLRIYVKGSSFRTMGESADLVNGFFASRLSRDDYLAKWTESKLPLQETGRSLLDLKADAKLVQRRLRAEVEQLLREDGVPESRLEEETDHLIAMLLGA
jgi:hypothetical protein